MQIDSFSDTHSDLLSAKSLNSYRMCKLISPYTRNPFKMFREHNNNKNNNILFEDRIMLHIEDAYHDCASVEFQKLPLYQIIGNR